MNTRRSGAGRLERGQAIILFVFLMSIIFLIGAMLIDFGLWFAERRATQRAADFAALAGSQDLPSDDTAAVSSALEWAANNGYTDGVDGVEVEVQLLCKNHISNPPDDICSNSNVPGSGPGLCNPGDGCDSMRVTIRRPADHLFTSVLGIGGTIIGAGAAAGLDVSLTPLDTVILLDATGSMGAAPCNPERNNSGCPIKEATDASNDFIDILISGDGGAGVTSIAHAPYRGCYNPPRTFSQCVPESDVVGLTGNADTLYNGVNSTTAAGGTGTNVCLALLTGWGLLQGTGAQAGASQFAVILTDGDNTYNSASFDASQGAPPAACRPADPQDSDGYFGTGCSDAQQREVELDVRTNAQASVMKAAGLEIFVVAFGVCGGISTSPVTSSYCAGIGDGQGDDIADQRLLRCVATSEDHYFRTDSATDLPEIFRAISWEIVGRGLLQ